MIVNFKESVIWSVTSSSPTQILFMRLSTRMYYGGAWRRCQGCSMDWYCRLTSLTFGRHARPCVALWDRPWAEARFISVASVPGDPGENQIKRYGAEHARLRRCEAFGQFVRAQGCVGRYGEFGLSQRNDHNMIWSQLLGSLGLAIGHINAAPIQFGLKIESDCPLIKTCKKQWNQTNNRTFDFQPECCRFQLWYC
jgi:hypothetical protein